MIQFTSNPFLDANPQIIQPKATFEDRPQATRQLYPSTYYQTKPIQANSTPSRESNSSNFW